MLSYQGYLERLQYGGWLCAYTVVFNNIFKKLFSYACRIFLKTK